MSTALASGSIWHAVRVYLTALPSILMMGVTVSGCAMQLGALVQPGVQFEGTWTGTYQCPMGVQHVETVQVTRRGRTLIATKVTGDDCVPAGFVSWEAALPSSVISERNLPLSVNAGVTAGSPGSPMQRVLGRLTIVAPNRMVVEGAGGIELTRDMSVPAPQPGVASRPDFLIGTWEAQSQNNAYFMTVTWNPSTNRYEGRLSKQGSLSAQVGFPLGEVVWTATPLAIPSQMEEQQQLRAGSNGMTANVEWRRGAVYLDRSSPDQIVTSSMVFRRVAGAAEAGVVAAQGTAARADMGQGPVPRSSPVPPDPRSGQHPVATEKAPVPHVGPTLSGDGRCGTTPVWNEGITAADRAFVKKLVDCVNPEAVNVAKIDLNGDGRPDFFVLENDGATCIKTGCPTKLYLSQGDTYVKVFEDAKQEKPKVDSRVTEGVCDLANRGVRYAWNGKVYKASGPAPRRSDPSKAGPAPGIKANGIRKVNWKKRTKDRGDFGGVIYADLDGDWGEEALVVTSNELRIRTETFTNIFTMRNGVVEEFPKPSPPPELANSVLGSVEMAVREGRLVVTYTFGEAECCVSDELLTSYAWQGGQWVEDRAARRLTKGPE